jgi:hypothetical protein
MIIDIRYFLQKIFLVSFMFSRLFSLVNSLATSQQDAALWADIEMPTTSYFAGKDEKNRIVLTVSCRVRIGIMVTVTKVLIRLMIRIIVRIKR